MNSFRKFLLSYLCTLLLPIGILTFVISKVVFSFCSQQIMEQNISELKLLQTVMEAQEKQMNAYAVQTTLNTDFYARNQKQAGDIFPVQNVLKQWLETDSFIDDVSYFNTVLNRVYSYDSVHTIEGYSTFHLDERDGLSEAAIQAVFHSGASKAWLCAENKKQLYYFASARISHKEKIWLIFRISMPVLDKLCHQSANYENDVMWINLGDEKNLYTTDLNIEPSNLTEFKGSYGRTSLSGEKVMYARVSGTDLTYMILIPEKEVNAPLQDLWRIYYVGLILIAIIGSIVIWFMMRVNYSPIHRLEDKVLQANVLDNPSKDAIDNVSQAFQMIQQRNQAITVNSRIFSKERAIFRLLMGVYPTVKEFNVDGEAVGFHLEEGCLYIIAIQKQSDSSDSMEEFPTQRIEEVCRKNIQAKSLLFLEIPENQEIIFVISGEPDPLLREKLISVFKKNEIQSKIMISKTCTETEQLAAVWNDLYSSNLQKYADTSGFPEELYSILSNAIAFEEPNRIMFAIEGMCNSLKGRVIRDVRAPLFEVMYLSRSRCGDNASIVKSLDNIMPEIRKMDPHNVEQAEQFLRVIGQSVCSYLLPEEDNPNQLCNKIESFLTLNYTDPELTVQNVAELYGFTLSNLSHYFKSHTGKSVSGYIEELRINQAKNMLENTNMPIAEVSASVGYAQATTFMRAYKKLMGMSPSAWRNAYKKHQ